jgi:hypothetical protein
MTISSEVWSLKFNVCKVGFDHMKGLELEMQCFQGGISTHHLVGGTIGLNALKKSHLLLEMSVVC